MKSGMLTITALFILTLLGVCACRDSTSTFAQQGQTDASTEIVEDKTAEPTDAYATPSSKSTYTPAELFLSGDYPVWYMSDWSELAYDTRASYVCVKDGDGYTCYDIPHFGEVWDKKEARLENLGQMTDEEVVAWAKALDDDPAMITPYFGYERDSSGMGVEWECIFNFPFGTLSGHYGTGNSSVFEYEFDVPMTNVMGVDYFGFGYTHGNSTSILFARVKNGSAPTITYDMPLTGNDDDALNLIDLDA